MNSNMNPECVEHADYSTIIQIIEKLYRFGVSYICLVGGDPAEHPQIESIMEEIHNRGITVSIMSNTMKFSDPFRASKAIDNIDATIHGCNSTEHDSFCGCPGAYDLLTSNLKYFSDCGININLAVNVTPVTFDKAYTIVQGIINKGIKVNQLLTQRILPYGRASGTSCWNTTAEQVNFFFSQAQRAVHDFGIDVSVEDPYPFCCIDNQYHKFMHGCPEGRDRMAIGMHGEVFRCGAEPVSSNVNVLKCSMDYIWNESGVFDVFRMKKYLPSECIGCSLINTCQGGCPISCEKCKMNGWILKKQ